MAHHGFGTFSMDEDIELTGTVTDLAFVNPHSWLYLDVVGENGQVEAHRCEMRSANTLRRSGWTPEMFTIGELITITGSPDRNDPYSCYVGTVIFADGSSIDRYGQRTPPTVIENAARPPRLANGQINISGDWAAEQRVMTDPRGQLGTLVPLSTADAFGIGGVPEGQQPIPGARGTEQAARGIDAFGGGRRLRSPVPLTASGQAALEAIVFAELPTRTCRSMSIIFDWGSDSPVNRVIQAPDRVVLQYGRLGLERVVPIVAEHPADIVPSRAGHSIARWDDDVLVVETIGFEPGLMTQSLPHSGELHVVEYFSLDPETHQLTRRYEASDTNYWTETYAGEDVLNVADIPFDPPRCDDRTLADDTPLGARD